MKTKLLKCKSDLIYIKKIIIMIIDVFNIYNMQSKILVFSYR